MIITLDIPRFGSHWLKLNVNGISNIHPVKRHTFGEFILTVYFDDNRYIDINFLNDTVKFDISVGYQYNIDHYSHFARDGRYVFECSEIDLFNPVKNGNEETRSSED